MPSSIDLAAYLDRFECDYRRLIKTLKQAEQEDKTQNGQSTENQQSINIWEVYQAEAERYLAEIERCKQSLRSGEGSKACTNLVIQDNKLENKQTNGENKEDKQQIADLDQMEGVRVSVRLGFE